MTTTPNKTRARGIAKDPFVARIEACAVALQKQANTMPGEYRDYWGDRARLVKGWAADVRLGYRKDFDEIIAMLEELERMVKA